MEDNNNILGILLNGGVGVMPTDTIYGLVGSALSEKTVQRMYELRKRSPAKPFIILIHSVNDLGLFGIKINKKTEKLLLKFWPGPVSIILPCLQEKFSYLHRGVQTLAFRLPQKIGLADLLKKTGPLVAPSANPEGLSPAKNIQDAKKYFGEEIDFYLNGGEIDLAPSALISITDGKILVLRDAHGVN